jgi:hypothetical protein
MSDTFTPMQPPSRVQNRTALAITISFVVFVVAGGWYLRTHRAGASSFGGMGGVPSNAWPSKTVNGITIHFSGELRMPASEIQIEFKNAQGQLVDVGAVKLALDMNMPGMVMHGDADVTGGNGRYIAKVKPQMAGGWTAKLTFNGPQGSGETSFSVNVK